MCCRILEESRPSTYEMPRATPGSCSQDCLQTLTIAREGGCEISPAEHHCFNALTLMRLKNSKEPWPAWLSWLDIVLQSEGSPV